LDNDYTAAFGAILNSYSPIAPSNVVLILESRDLQSYKKNEVVFPEKKKGVFFRANFVQRVDYLNTAVFHNNNYINNTPTGMSLSWYTETLKRYYAHAGTTLS
jgi:hypothetical protein